jgi:hypothetical protein
MIIPKIRLNILWKRIKRYFNIMEKIYSKYRKKLWSFIYCTLYTGLISPQLHRILLRTFTIKSKNLRLDDKILL